jgi:chromosome segregation ATPase
MTQRCSFCDIAHDETDSRCPTDLEYERGYRNGINQKAKELEPIKRQLEAAYAHERQTHEQLGAILGTDDSLEECAKRMQAKLAAAEARCAEQDAQLRRGVAHAEERVDLLQRLAAAEADIERLKQIVRECVHAVDEADYYNDEVFDRARAAGGVE